MTVRTHSPTQRCREAIISSTSKNPSILAARWENTRIPIPAYHLSLRPEQSPAPSCALKWGYCSFMYLLTSGFLFTTEVTFHECGPMTLLWAVPASTDGIRPDPPDAHLWAPSPGLVSGWDPSNPFADRINSPLISILFIGVDLIVLCLAPHPGQICPERL